MEKSIYEVIEKTDTAPSQIKRIDADGQVWLIPINEANSDYQRYLNPEAEQSTPNLS
jgi:hypothetical protein